MLSEHPPELRDLGDPLCQLNSGWSGSGSGVSTVPGASFRFRPGVSL